MISGEAMLEADLELATLAGAGVGERQHLPAPPDRAGGLPLLLRIAVAGLLVPLQRRLLFLPAAPGGLDRRGADFADHNLPALMVRVRALVGPVRSVLQTENLVAGVAVEGKKIELIAFGMLAVHSKIWESLCSCHSLFSMNLSSCFLNWMRVGLRFDLKMAMMMAQIGRGQTCIYRLLVLAWGPRQVS